MEVFKTTRLAKDYLAGKIADRARQDNSPLSEIERKMLYFSETDWTLPEMPEVSSSFDREYDQDAYEQKIAGLVRSIKSHLSPEEQECWDAAVLKLCEGDHYLLVLIDGAAAETHKPIWLHKLGPWLPKSGSSKKRDPGDLKRLFFVAFLLLTLLFIAQAIRIRFE